MSPTKPDLLGVPGIEAAGNLFIDLFIQGIINFKDGVQGKDFLSFIAPILAGAGNVDVFKNIGAEFRDGINDEQRVQLIEGFKQRFISAKLGLANEPEIYNLAVTVANALNANLAAIKAGIVLNKKRKGINPADV